MKAECAYLRAQCVYMLRLWPSVAWLGAEQRLINQLLL